MKKIKIAFLVLFLGLIIFNVWTYFKLREITTLDNQQNSAIVGQDAAWGVLINSFPEDQRQPFLNAVNQILTATST